MKKSILIVFLFFSLVGYAQEERGHTGTNKIKEFGVQFNNLDNFGLTLKKGNGKHFWRFGVLNLQSSQSTSFIDDEDLSDMKDKSKGFGFKFGFERRKKQTEDFETYWGLDLLYSYSKITDVQNPEGDTQRLRNISKGLGFVLGVNYHISSKFMISAEIEPSYMATRVKLKDDAHFDYTSIGKTKGFNFDSNSASLTLSYTF